MRQMADYADYLGPIIVGAIVAGVGLLGSRRGAAQSLRQKPRDVIRLTTSLGNEEIFELTRRYAFGAKMTVEDADPAEGRIILGQDMRGFHNGFWLPLYLSKDSDRMTVVEVGILSKTYQASPVLNRIRNKAAEEIGALLRAQEK